MKIAYSAVSEFAFICLKFISAVIQLMKNFSSFRSVFFGFENIIFSLFKPVFRFLKTILLFQFEMLLSTLNSISTDFNSCKCTSVIIINGFTSIFLPCLVYNLPTYCISRFNTDNFGGSPVSTAVLTVSWTTKLAPCAVFFRIFPLKVVG